MGSRRSWLLIVLLPMLVLLLQGSGDRPEQQTSDIVSWGTWSPARLTVEPPFVPTTVAPTTTTILPTTTTTVAKPRPPVVHAASAAPPETAAPVEEGSPPPMPEPLRRICACECTWDPNGPIVWTSENRRGSSASGGCHALDSTWRSWARSYGGDVGATAYSRALHAPWWVQQTVFVRAYNAQGSTPWKASRGCWG